MAIDEERLHQLIGERIKERRHALSLTQLQLAERVGLERASISNIEAGRQKSPLVGLYRISKALEWSIDKLLPEYEEAVLPRSAESIFREAGQIALPQATDVLKRFLDPSTVQEEDQ